ncbi:MAG: holo-ACP synthase [Desulfobacteraceae bacterium]|nr:holo-ACP synthase [Desulfobacteraceae bacterium]
MSVHCEIPELTGPGTEGDVSARENGIPEIRILQGIDLVVVAKIRKMMADHPRFAEEVFTPGEREYCRSMADPSVHFAGRFAAKEACVKALGTGLAAGGIDSAFVEIEVVRGTSGKPELLLSGWTAKLADRKKIYQNTVSISHSGDFAVASVIFASLHPGS